MEIVMGNETDFILKKLISNDLLIVKVLEKTAEGLLVAHVVETIKYGSAVDKTIVGENVEFIYAGPNWGRTSLQVGDMALLFLSDVFGVLYECNWQGHMLIESVSGVPHAIYKAKEYWLNKNCPQSLKEYSKQDPKRESATAIELIAIKKYIERNYSPDSQ